MGGGSEREGEREGGREGGRERGRWGRKEERRGEEQRPTHVSTDINRDGYKDIQTNGREKNPWRIKLIVTYRDRGITRQKIRDKKNQIIHFIIMILQLYSYYTIKTFLNTYVLLYLSSLTNLIKSFYFICIISSTDLINNSHSLLEGLRSHGMSL